MWPLSALCSHWKVKTNPVCELLSDKLVRSVLTACLHHEAQPRPPPSSPSLLPTPRLMISLRLSQYLPKLDPPMGAVPLNSAENLFTHKWKHCTGVAQEYVSLLKNRAITWKEWGGGIGLIQRIGVARSQTLCLKTNGVEAWGAGRMCYKERGGARCKTSAPKVSQK